MNSIADELSELKKEFESFDNEFDRYTYLTELSSLLPEYGNVRSDEDLFKDCQSKVWLKVRNNKGVCVISAYSDTLIIRGILYIFIHLLNGRNVDEVEEAKFDVLQDLGIDGIFSGNRKLGVSGLLPEIIRRLKNGI